MPRAYLPASEMLADEPVITEPADLGEFWAHSLADARDIPLAAQLGAVDAGLRTLRSCDITFRGYGGSLVRAWHYRPAGWSQQQRPAAGRRAVPDHGGGRGLVQENTFWAPAGCDHLIMDTRRQGSSWSSWQTPDPEGSGPAQPGLLTRGIAQPGIYFYRRVFVEQLAWLASIRLPA